MRRSIREVPFQMNIRIILFMIFLCMVIIVSRLWNLQITHGEEYREISKNNQVRKIILTAPRGNIYDRNGVVLADTRPSYDLTVFLEDVDDVEPLAEALAPIIQIDKEDIKSRLQKAMTDRMRLPYIPYTLKKDLDLSEIIRIEEINFELPGVSISPVPIRHYTHDGLTAHVVGYIGKISRSEYETLGEKGYLQWDTIGKTGAEKSFEEYLKGVHGGKQVQIDNRNLLVSVLGKKDPVQGNDVYLTIDVEIQKKIIEAFGEYKGVCILMNARTGEILSYVSRPGFDPNVFATGDASISQLFVDENHPLVDRVISGEYAPGSTFKPVVALAALKNRIIDDKTSVLCTGVFTFGGIRFKCWKRYGHGEVNLNTSLEQSCNVFYYNIGKEIGWEPIYETGRLFGFGSPTGFIFEGEKSGILPSEDWKKAKLGEPWYKGESINYSIGQGYLLVTPLQMAVYAAALGNRGTILRPFVEKRIVGNDGVLIDQGKAEYRKNLNLNEQSLEWVRHGLYCVVNSKKGTGRRASLLKELNIEVSGKTGTAQAAEGGERINHSWFMSYAPSGNPVVACIVLVERKDSGAQYAAPIAHVALKAYFEKYPLPQEAPSQEEKEENS
ncbi:MAG: penicillin-binding protein 2 [Candidatus Aureabacteria bacterium]|nr:penicillin-binding protein 2 [Candidatus Auribacterota bacterium]